MIGKCVFWVLGVESPNTVGAFSFQAPFQMGAYNNNGGNTALLTMYQDLVRNSPNYAPGGGGLFNSTRPNQYTWCNQATMDIINYTGANLTAFIGSANRYMTNANAMVSAMQSQVSSGVLTSVNATQAQALANSGFTVVAGWINPTGGSGHVATLRPSSDPANFSDPLVSNVGARNNITTISNAFRGNQVQYFFNVNQNFRNGGIF